MTEFTEGYRDPRLKVRKNLKITGNSCGPFEFESTLISQLHVAENRLGMFISAQGKVGMMDSTAFSFPNAFLVRKTKL